MSENSLLENVDIAELVQHVDIENVLKEVDLRQLLKQVDLESVLGGFGAAAGSQLGTRAGRRLDGLFETGDDSTNGSTHENDDAETESGTETGASDEESTESEEEADADTSAAESDDEPGESGVESDGTDAEPESRADLEALSYRDLQSLTKDTDVKGNISKDRMVDELADEFDFGE